MPPGRPSFPFDRGGYRHRLERHAGRVCLVARENLTTGSVHWEVVVLVLEPEKRWPKGDVVPAHFRYPGDKEWGNAGWTYTSRPEALQKYRSLGQRKALKGGSWPADNRAAS